MALDRSREEAPRSAGTSPLKKESLDSLDIADLQCPICMNTPEGHILQCPRGHLYCEACFRQMVAQKPQCSVCRVNINPTMPLQRNLFAERMIARMPRECENKKYGCDAKLTAETLENHEKKECGYLPGTCKGALAGCTWSGFVKDVEVHQRQCPRVTLLPLCKEMTEHLDHLYAKMEDRIMRVADRLDGLETAQKKLMKGARVDKIFTFNVHGDRGEQLSRLFEEFNTTWEIKVFGEASMSFAGIGLALRPVAGEGMDSRRKYDVTLHCIHPITPNMKYGFQYDDVELSARYYLEERVFLSNIQVKFFVALNGEMKVQVGMKQYF